ncbi:hypothetical protein HPB47_002581, partial [Ixodes persulcatus]
MDVVLSGVVDGAEGRPREGDDIREPSDIHHPGSASPVTPSLPARAAKMDATASFSESRCDSGTRRLDVVLYFSRTSLKNSSMFMHMHACSQELWASRMRRGPFYSVIPSGEVAEASAIPVGCSSAFETFETPARTERLSSRAVPMDKDGSAQTAYRTGYNVMNSRVSDGTNVCSVLLTFISLLIISLTCPFSLFFCIK